jgi:hypothetical protein
MCWAGGTFKAPFIPSKHSSAEASSKRPRPGSCCTPLLRKCHIHLVQKQAEVLLRLCVAAHHDFPSVCRWQVDVEYLDGRKFFEYRPRCKPARTPPQPRFECHL